jgi:methylthioribose-1-phosphate isomerase
MATAPCTESPPPLHWNGTTLRILDQTRLPGEELVLELHGTPDTVEAIKRLAVRGAPMIGIAAAYGLAMELARDETPAALGRAAALMAGARPTARNLGWAVERVTAAALAAPGRMADAAREAAEQIHREDEAASAALARHGAEALEAILPDGPVAVMTHCNSGALAASGRGTGLGVIAELAERREVHVLACEARPLLQGARLTAWELEAEGIPHTVIADSAAGALLAAGDVDCVFVGADRIAANGDTANKVGTYPLAVLAARHEVPFHVVAPSSSVDLSIGSGADIPIEERDSGEVSLRFDAWNPAFDVTPAELISAIVTEHGVHRAPYAEALGAVVPA